MKLFKLLIAILFSSSLFSGGPWGQGKGKSYVQLGGGVIPGTNQLFFNGNETLKLNRKINDANFGLYAEYGLFKNFTLIGELPINFVSSSNSVDSINLTPLLPSGKLIGLGNTKLTAQYLFYDGNIKIAGGVKFSFATAVSDNKTGLRTGYQSFDVMPKLSFGYSKNKFYGYSEVGYNFRSRLANDYHLSIELGYKVYKEIYTALNFGALLSSIDKNELTRLNEQTGLYANGQEFSALTIKFSVPLNKKLGFNLSSTIANFHGNYVQKSPALGASLYWKL